MKTSVCPIVVLAKTPLAGFAKSRLIPALGAEGAAALAEQLLRRTVREANAARVGPVELCGTPDIDGPLFQELQQLHGVQLTKQIGADLGERMARALNRWVWSNGRCILIGTDAPAVDAKVLQRAAAALDRADCVFVPAYDGGYALVGLRQEVPCIFTKIDWSTPSVMETTRERVLDSGLSLVELDAVHDIDEPADLAHLPESWAK